jgi:hypothetical protein
MLACFPDCNEYHDQVLEHVVNAAGREELVPCIRLYLIDAVTDSIVTVAGSITTNRVDARLHKFKQSSPVLAQTSASPLMGPLLQREHELEAGRRQMV